MQQFRMKTNTIQQFTIRSVRGGYKFGNGQPDVILQLHYKPKWFHRFMMKLCFGLYWVDNDEI